MGIDTKFVVLRSKSWDQKSWFWTLKS